MIRSILTVLVPAVSHDLTTLETLKDDLGITDNRSDTTLRRFISEASGTIEVYCNRVFAEETVQEVFWRDWRSAYGSLPQVQGLMLRRSPVSSITSVTEDVNDPLVAVTDYTFDPETGFLYRLWDTMPTFWRGGTTTVIYTAGYSLLGGLPYSLEQACLTLCRQRWSGKGRDPSVKVIDVPGVMRQEYWVGATGDNGAVPPEVEGLLAPFRNRNI